MTRTNPTTFTTGTVVEGWVKFFKADKGFGFATVMRGSEQVDVFLGKRQAYLLDGTHQTGFTLTNDTVDCTAYNFRRRDTTMVTLELEPSRKGGWQARRWGIQPEFTWIDLHLNYPELTQAFVGGRVELYNSSEYGVGGYTARIDQLELTHQQLNLHATHRPHGWWPGDTVDKAGKAFETSYDLAPVTCVERGGQMELTWRDHDSYNRLTLWPARRPSA